MEADVQFRLPQHLKEKSERADDLQEIVKGKDEIIETILAEI